ncbi:MAG: sel1 repeat family protein [Campylobacterales bacterium]|nr:sel1 repeat family protein [Campylobacterales bacterium]
MRFIFSLILSIILFAGCANTTANPTLQHQKDTKQELIKKANSGDVKAMLDLNSIYLFPKTKQGAKLYRKWRETLLQSKNPQDILTFATVYEKEKNIFINGEENYLELLKKAATLGSKEALFLIQEFYVKKGKNYKHKEFRDIEEQITKDANQDTLIKLYDLYNAQYKTKAADRIKELMKERKYTPNLNTQFSILQSLLKERGSEQKIQTINKNILASKNYQLILKTAELFLQKRFLDESLTLYQKALEMKKEADTYYTIAEIYRKKRMLNYTWKSREFEKEINENLHQAMLLDHFEGTKALLKTYYYGKEYSEKYKELEQKLLQHNEGKRALASIYINYDREKREKAYVLLDELASQNNEKAIVELATKANIKSSKNLAAFTKKWQEFILNSNNPALLEKAKKSVHIYKAARFKELRDFRDKILQIQLQEKNIYTIRELYTKYQDKDDRKADKYTQMAIDAGDVFTINSLIKKYRREGSEESINKAIELYTILSDRGDITATNRLADIYYFGINGNKDMVDIKKAIIFMEKAYNPQDTYTLKKLAKLYMLDKELANLTKAKPYIAELIKQGYAKEVFNLTWKLDKRKQTPVKDILDLYKLAGEAGQTEAFYAIGWSYYVQKDYTNTIKYLEKAAQKYNINALVMLGNLYINGEGVEKDITKAIEYYELADDNTHALYNLGYAYASLNDYKQAIYYYKRSGRKNNQMANYALGEIYKNGYGVKQNFQEAIKYYKRADTKEAYEQIKRLEKSIQK